MGTRSGAWFNSYAPELVPMFYYRDKTRVHMFYFLNNISLSYFNMYICTKKVIWTQPCN